jgi:hypothetical protein
MQQFTLTTQTNRNRGLAKHNDRTYKDEIGVEHSEKEKNNCYEKKDPLLSAFEENERKIYEDLFKLHVIEHNEGIKASRHYKRGYTDLNKIYTSPKTRPDEIILEIGNKDNHPNSEVLKSVYDEFKKWHDDRFPYIIRLDSALHLDETTPHIHIRQVYVYCDDKGVLHPNQHKCLEAHGLTLPDPDKPRSQKNNLKMAYSKEIRDKLKEICLSHNIEIIKAEERPDYLKDLSKDEYLDYLIKQNEKTKLELKQKEASLNELLHPEKFIERYVLEHNNDKEFQTSKYAQFGLREEYEKSLIKKAKLLVEEKTPEKYKELQQKHSYHMHM